MEPQTPGKNQFEARMIQLLRRRFEEAQFKVEDHLKVGQLPLEIDLIVSSEREQENNSSKSLPPLFSYFQRHNVVELKTEVDPLEIGDLLKLQAYAWLYMEKQRVYSIGAVTATAIVHHLTATVAAALPQLGYEPAGQGIFKRKSDLTSFLISINDVPDEVTPEELLIFSSAERRRRVFISSFGDPNKNAILETITDLYKKEAIALMTSLNIREEAMPEFIDALGRKKVIAALSKEEHLSALNIKEEAMPEFIDALGRKKVIAALSKEEHLSALKKEELLAALSDEDLLAALQGKEQLVQSFLAKLQPEQLRKLIPEVGRG